ncbi:quinone oxidoreductase [Dyadobacter chenwenxiniae]|uniref:Quinone oxidoreductase n=1 Tax=Dyadobacter chenwenxiniae TaxID=2906456 RepID=A0A9X1PNK7_9BACT|nr:quinone oxidoreductase [Dyadobacter chenwenxiniae]MCF0064637.1 quinone oxidoreductase [Dyadobacter chenwenxiniae]UON84307.1 quinone oxidoreductase [Dyadobacter chenwenxiniae]
MNATDKSGVVQISKQGPPSVLEYTNEIVGNPGNNQVLIRQKAIALNFVDVMFRNGTFPLNHFPATIGVEAAGVVEAVGTGANEWNVGDRVGYYFALGAYAEKRLINKDQLIKLPDDISFDQAASLMAKGLTARMLVKQAYAVQPGDVVLVHAAAGGVGSLVSRWAKSLGAVVIGTVGNASKKALAESQGIDLVIALDSQDLAEQVGSITNGLGVDAVFDGVGKATFSKSAPLVKRNGHIVLYGNASGSPHIDADFLASKNISLIRPSVGEYLPDKHSLDFAVGELFEAVRTGVFGDIKPTIYSLSEVFRAHDDLEATRTTGSVILHP